MPWKLALAVREAVAGHTLGALEGGVYPSPSPMHPSGTPHLWMGGLVAHPLRRGVKKEGSEKLWEGGSLLGDQTQSPSQDVWRVWGM